MRFHRRLALALALAVSGLAPAQVVTYEFNNTYAADQPGAPALNPYAPGTGTLTFITDTVNVGSQSLTRTVLNRGGVTGAAQTDQAGVELTTTSLLTNPNAYSIDMVFSLSTFSVGSQRVLNSNDASDNGLYTRGNVLSIFNGSSHDGTHTLTLGASTYHHLALTYDGTTANEYLDGALDDTLATTATANPNNLMRFFLDNASGGSNSEYGPGRVALVRLWDQVLTAGQVATLANSPFSPVPEPGSLALAGAAAALGAAVVRRRRAPARPAA